MMRVTFRNIREFMFHCEISEVLREFALTEQRDG